MFWGYDISAHPLELAKSRANDRLHFVQADIRRENTCFFDLILVLDVIEHLEDYISFLREIKPTSQYKIFHYFTVEIALQVLRDVDYEILDYCYTARAIEQPTHELRRKLLKLPRKLLFAIHQDLAAHLLGGWSLLVLAK
jgi:2-polyprenyl-3-methyl-5-hydroxy-6-metoxy-1,4-benzoquinol methylase